MSPPFIALTARLKASTFSSDIAYSASPVASRASAFSAQLRIRMGPGESKAIP
jgi:hypothetical protein